MAAIRLHKFQTAAIKASVHEKIPFVLLLSGVQGGKTFAGAAWELIQWSLSPKADHLITAPTYRVLQASTLRKLDAIIPKGWAEFNKAEQTYSLASGGKVFCRSLEDPDAIEGITAASVWGDEAGKYVAQAWENIQARRSATRGPVLLTTTPYGINWLKFQFYDLWAQGLPEYRVVHFRSVDSPYFPAEEWNRAKRDLAPRAFQRKFGGIFTRLEGTIYEDFDIDTMAEVLPSVPRAWEKIGGLDFGFSEGHPCGVSIWGSPAFGQEKHRVYKLAEYKRPGRLLGELLQTIRNLEVYTGAVSVWYADPSAAQEIAELRRLGLNIRAANNDVEFGIQHLTMLMRTSRYRIEKKRCPLTLDELGTYHRDEKDRIVKENDHLLDADRYALFTHMAPSRTIRIR